MDIREKIVLALTSTTREQCCFTVVRLDGAACANGVIHEALIPEVPLENYFLRQQPVYDNLKRVGLSPKQVSQITNMNDGTLGYEQHSFDEIAKVIKDWPADS